MIRTRSRTRGGGSAWYKSTAYLLNNVSPSLFHDYAKNRYYNTTDGVISFPVTTTRTTNATMFDSSGNLVWAPANMIAQSSTTGAVLGVIGSGGVMPTGWSSVSVAGITREVVAITSEYIDLRLYGTNGSGSIVYPHIKFSPAISVVLSQNYTLSASAAVVAGDYTGFNAASGALTCQWLNSGTYVSEMSGSTKFTSSTLVRFAASGVAPASGITQIQPQMNMVINIGTTVDITLRLSNPQLEYKGIDSPKPYINTTGTAYYGPRLDYNPATLQPRGYLIEVQRTNSIRNNMLIGGVAGSPGTAPTNWSISSIPGVTITTAYGVENGMTYIDVTYSGTNTSGALAYPTITPEQANSVAAASGQTWTHSAFAKKVSGADSESQWNVGFLGRDSGGSIVSGESVTTDFVGGARLSDSRVQVSRTFVDAAVAFAQPRITRDSLGIGATMDITIRIGLPQFEQGAFATSAIPTYGVAATRSGDIANLITPPPYSATGTTYYAEFERQGTPVNSSSEASSGVWFFGTSGGTQVSAPFGFGAANQIRVDLYESGTQQCALSDFATPFTVHKLCARVAPNDARAAYDTVLTAPDITVVMPVSIPTTVQAIGRRENATHQMHGWLKDFRIYETAAPDASLQAITA